MINQLNYLKQSQFICFFFCYHGVVLSVFAVLWMCQYTGKSSCKMKVLLVFGVFVVVVFGQDEDITCTQTYCEVSVKFF